MDTSVFHPWKLLLQVSHQEVGMLAGNLSTVPSPRFAVEIEPALRHAADEAVISSGIRTSTSD